ncbi:MAG: FecR family protein [Bacillota bacterium]
MTATVAARAAATAEGWRPARPGPGAAADRPCPGRPDRAKSEAGSQSQRQKHGPLARRRETCLSRLSPFLVALAMTAVVVAPDEGGARGGAAGSAAARPAAVRAVRVHGDVRWRPDGDPVWRMLQAGVGLAPGDWVRTGSASFAELVYLDEAARILVEGDTLLQVGGGYRSLAQVAAVRGDLPGYRAALLRAGSIWAQVVSGLSRLWRFEVTTPTAVAGVRGTVFRLQVGPRGETRLYVKEGVVELRSARTRWMVSAGEAAGEDGRRLEEFMRESEGGAPKDWDEPEDADELVRLSDAQRLAWLERLKGAFEDDLLEDDGLRAKLLEQALAAEDSQRSGLVAWLRELEARARSGKAAEEGEPGEVNGDDGGEAGGSGTAESSSGGDEDQGGDGSGSEYGAYGDAGSGEEGGGSVDDGGSFDDGGSIDDGGSFDGHDEQHDPGDADRSPSPAGPDSHAALLSAGEGGPA